jgi:hypothetical protein
MKYLLPIITNIANFLGYPQQPPPQQQPMHQQQQPPSLQQQQPPSLQQEKSPQSKFDASLSLLLIDLSEIEKSQKEKIEKCFNTNLKDKQKIENPTNAIEYRYNYFVSNNLETFNEYVLLIHEMNTGGINQNKAIRIREIVMEFDKLHQQQVFPQRNLSNINQIPVLLQKYKFEYCYLKYLLHDNQKNVLLDTFKPENLCAYYAIFSVLTMLNNPEEEIIPRINDRIEFDNFLQNLINKDVKITPDVYDESILKILEDKKQEKSVLIIENGQPYIDTGFITEEVVPKKIYAIQEYNSENDDIRPLLK